VGGVVLLGGAGELLKAFLGSLDDCNFMHSSAAKFACGGGGCRFQSVSNFFRRKPRQAPSGALSQGCANTGVPASECVVLEDVPPAFAAARRRIELSLSGQPFGIQNCVARGRLGAGDCTDVVVVDKTARLTLRLNG